MPGDTLGQHRPSFDALGMATALLWSARSPDCKVKVGACILDHHHRVVGVGYNGRAAGEENTRESLLHGAGGLIHAETNVLLAANWNGERHTLYCTHAPCAACARLIINSRRIIRVLYGISYAETFRLENNLPSGPDLMRAAGLEVLHAP